MVCSRTFGRCHKWQDYLKAMRLGFGHCLKLAISIFKVKNKSLQPAATKLFENTCIKITTKVPPWTEQEFWTEPFSKQFIRNKVDGWAQYLQLLFK